MVMRTIDERPRGGAVHRHAQTIQRAATIATLCALSVLRVLCDFRR
jgi:hypothetical protein